MNKRILAIFASLITASYAFDAMAQDSLPSKPDLSNPDIISRPPMDPYSLSYIPEKPQNARNITTVEECTSAGGRWGSVSESVPINMDLVFRLAGCIINGQKEGRWMYSVDHGKNDKFYTTLDEKTALGYVWMTNGKKEGWEVFLNQPEDFARLLRFYANGTLAGTEFTWNEMGALISVNTYKEGGILDGKYESYLGCLPLELGQYKDGNPAGKWEFFSEPGKLNMRRDFDRIATREQLPPDAPDEFIAFWTEWYNDDGVKIADGFSAIEAPDDPGKRVGDIQLYMTVGTPWLKIKYNAKGQIDDQYTFDLCMNGGITRKPDFVDYDHEEVFINCNGPDAETYRRINFYRTGEVWKVTTIENGRANGRVKEYHPAKDGNVYGSILAVYDMKNDVPEGKIEFFDTNGVLMGEPSLIQHGSGHFKSWWHNGNPSEEGDYYHGDKTGHWQKWYDTGSLETENEYKNGYKHGVQKQWFNNGVLAIELNYSGGSRNGATNVYYTDGHIAYQYNYQSGSPTGTWISYTHGGQISSDTDYRKGAYDSAKQNVYYTDGSLQATGNIYPGFGNDIKTGHWDYYLKGEKDKPGKRWYSVEYQNDAIVSAASTQCSKIQGEYKIDPENRELGCTVCAVNREAPLQVLKMREDQWQWYSTNGSLEKKGSIHLGHMNDEWEYYYPNGKPMLRGNYVIDRKMGTWTGYYEDGHKKFSGKYENGVETGLWTTYHDLTEKVSSEGNFIDGKRDGKWVWKYPEGQIKEEGSFEKGKETGTWVSYYENGQKKGSGDFIDGVREGEWTWWREDGTPWRTANYVKGKEK